MLSFVAETVEYQNWGLNALTISFFVSVGLTLFTAWGLMQQNKTLWREKTGEAVSIVWLSYYAVLQLVILTYGLSVSSAALMLNGLLALVYIPILAGLWKFKGFSTFDRLASIAFVGALLAMILTPYKPLFFLLFAIGGLLSALMQPIEMWRKKSAAGFEIKLMYVLIFGNIVWFVYGVAVSDPILITINALAFIIFNTTLILARTYKIPPAK